MSLRLQTVAQKFYLQSDRILTTFNNTVHPEVRDCCKNSHAPTRQQCVLSLYDAWTQFSKDLLLYSAQGGYITSNNRLLSRASNAVHIRPIDVVYGMSSRYGPTTPPSWGIPNDFIGIARRIGLANYLSISAAIGSTNSPAESIRMMRNYIAHKNAITANKAITSLSHYGAVSPLEVDRILLVRTNHGVTLFENWRNGLITVAFSSCA